MMGRGKKRNILNHIVSQSYTYSEKISQKSFTSTILHQLFKHIMMRKGLKRHTLNPFKKKTKTQKPHFNRKFRLFFFLMWTIFKVFMNLIQYHFSFVFCFFGHVACKISDLGSNYHLLHWKANSSPLDHQEKSQGSF